MIQYIDYRWPWKSDISDVNADNQNFAGLSEKQKHWHLTGLTFHGRVFRLMLMSDLLNAEKEKKSSRGSGPSRKAFLVAQFHLFMGFRNFETNKRGEDWKLVEIRVTDMTDMSP